MSFALSDRWNWLRVTSYLSAREALDLQAVCKSWQSSLTSLANGFVVNLKYDGLAHAASLLEQASNKPALTQSVQRISFEFCNELQNFDLVPLGSFPKLTALNLNACRELTDSGIEIVAEKCKELRRIDLFWDVTLSDVSIHALTSAPFPPHLTHLNLSGLKHITDAAIVPLLNRCKNITFLDLTRCEAIKDDTLRAIGRNCSKVHTLLLYAAAHTLSDSGFEAMAKGLPQLTHIDLTGMKKLTDQGMSSIAIYCRKLRVVHLMWVTLLTDASLLAMSRSPLRELRTLSVHGNAHMTENGIETLAKGCKNIQMLDVNGCNKIGKYRMNKQELQKIFPKLEQLILL